MSHRKNEYFELAERETGQADGLSAIQENWTFWNLGEAGQSPMEAVLAFWADDAM